MVASSPKTAMRSQHSRMAEVEIDLLTSPIENGEPMGKVAVGARDSFGQFPKEERFRRRGFDHHRASASNAITTS